MSERSVPMFCRCCSQILQVIVDSNPEKIDPSQIGDSKKLDVLKRRPTHNCSYSNALYEDYQMKFK